MSGTYNLMVYYGLKPMSLEEEMALPEAAHETRANKMKIIDLCNSIRTSAEMIQMRTRGIPEDDDANHAAMVQELYDLVRGAYLKVFDAEMIGRV